MTLRQKLSLWFSTEYGQFSIASYRRELSFIAGIALLIGFLGFGYRWHSKRQEQHAYRVLADCMREYEKAVANSATWSDVEHALNLGYARYARTQVAPYFLAYKADVLLKQQKHDEAVAIFDALAEELPTTSPLYAPYMIKRALVKMDSMDAQIQKNGLEELTKLANDTNNQHRDRALYYLGLHYWSLQDIKQAQGIWQNLIALDSAQSESQSPWAALVREKILPKVV
jgi:hypothetical protein